MPSYLRVFYLQKLVKTKEEEKKEMDKASKKSSSVKRPNIPKR